MTRKQIAGVVVIATLTEIVLQGVRTWGAYHAAHDPEHTFPSKLGRAAMGSL